MHALCATMMLLAALVWPAMCNAQHEAHMHHAAPKDGVRISEATYQIPDISAVTMTGKPVRVKTILSDDKPVVLNFIYTTCTAICPITSQTFSNLLAGLGPDHHKINMVSFSIDPENDTPAKLTEYAKRFGKVRVWPHYTGTSADAIYLQQSFEVWRGDKMNHIPVVFMRPAHGSKWTRIDGFVTPEQLLGEVRKVMAAKS